MQYSRRDATQRPNDRHDRVRGDGRGDDRRPPPGRARRPDQIVASHPRAERRDHLRAEYGIRVVGDNRQAIDGADVVLLGIKPQMLAEGRPRDRAVAASAARSSSASSPGRRPTALIGTLGHDQVIRAMPNTPARLGKGVTVWYATPATTEEQRAQAAALLGALGTQIEVDDEKMVAMATAVSGTGPTYVFLVMEALIDAAVHLGFPRHLAHDLVVETLEGSALFAKQSQMHPAELRNMVTSPGGTSAAALHELESGRLRTVLSEAVWAAFRRTVELGDQLEASVAGDRRGSGDRPEPRPARVTAVATGVVDLRRAPLAELRAIDFRAAGRDYWADEAALHDRLIAVLGRPRRRRVATARRRAVRRRAGPTGRCSITSATSSTGGSSRSATSSGVLDGGRWPSDDDYDGGDFDTFNEGRRSRFADVAPAELRRRGRGRPRTGARVARRLPAETIRSDAAWGWVHQVLHGHAIDHLTVLEPWADQLRAPPGRQRPVRRRTRSRPGGPRSGVERFWRATPRSRPPSERRSRRCPTGVDHPPAAALVPRRSRRPPRRLVRRGRPGPRGAPRRRTAGRTMPPEGRRRLQRPPGPGRPRHAAGGARRRVRRRAGPRSAAASRR